MKTLFLTLSVLISSAAEALLWKSVFVAGDNSIANFDRAREEVSRYLGSRLQSEVYQFSSRPDFVNESRHVQAANFDNLLGLFESLRAGEGEGCLIHMTSHGARGRGFYLALSGILTPVGLAYLVNQACGQAPTIILISSCYSGQFITDELKGPNRVILTAASAERPSFGCSSATEYTYWDGCLLDQLPNSRTWQDLYRNVSACIATKESVLAAKASEPQAYFGENTTEWEILR